jgi:uracil-DNA glycosylase family 4
MKLMIVGESPSKTRPDGMQEVAFSGRTSHILWDELAKYGITRENCYVTNIITDHIEWKNITDEIAKCNHDRLEKEIQEQKPHVILAVGAKAREWFGRGKSYDGFLLHSKLYNCWITACVHPAAVARNPQLKNEFIDCIYVLSEVLNLV